MNRPIAPLILSLVSSRGDFSASCSATSGRPLVIVGTPNHMNAIRASAATIIHRIEGTLNQAQMM